MLACEPATVAKDNLSQVFEKYRVYFAANEASPAVKVRLCVCADADRLLVSRWRGPHCHVLVASVFLCMSACLYGCLSHCVCQVCVRVSTYLSLCLFVSI